MILAELNRTDCFIIYNLCTYKREFYIKYENNIVSHFSLINLGRISELPELQNLYTATNC
jgi:hypothetical protein